MKLGIESAPSSQIAINIGRIDLFQRHVLRTRKVHVIVVSQVLTSGFGDALGANRQYPRTNRLTATINRLPV